MEFGTVVRVKMQDLATEEFITRDIDVSNITVANPNATLDNEHHILGTKEQQEKGLLNWIRYRGNEQHDTWLDLIEWAILTPAQQ